MPSLGLRLYLRLGLVAGSSLPSARLSEAGFPFWASSPLVSGALGSTAVILRFAGALALGVGVASSSAAASASVSALALGVRFFGAALGLVGVPSSPDLSH